MRCWRLSIWFLLAVGLDAVCPGPSTGQTALVQNGAEGAWAAGESPRWSLRTIWRIGEVDGREEYEFGYLTNAVLGPRGRVFLTDFQGQDIRVFSGEGRFLRTIGGPGRGPGEFQGANGIAWDRQGRLWVSDPFNARYSVFDTAGSLLKSVRRAANSVAHWNQTLSFDPTGNLIDEFGPGRVHRVDTAGVVLDSISRNMALPGLSIRGPTDLQRYSGPMLEVQPFRPMVVSTVARDGSVWLTRSDQLRLIHLNWSGDTLRVIETQHRHPKLSRSERSQIEVALRGTDLTLEGLELGRQIVQSIIVLDDGHLLVQIEEKTGEPSDLFDVFDPSGKFLGSLRSEYPFALRSNASARGDTIIAVTEDDLGVNYVVRYQLDRGGNSGGASRLPFPRRRLGKGGSSIR